jgi:hypothetical protein
MNRIRKYKSSNGYNTKWQVIMTPHQDYNVGFEYLLGSWTDEGIMGFKVLEFDSYDRAVEIATNHPDINWDQLVDFHKDSYLFLGKLIGEIVSDSNMICRTSSKLLTPDEAKDRMFERIQRYEMIGDTRSVLEQNDLISYRITNPWSGNLAEIARRLMRSQRLRIFKKMEDSSILSLIGRTDIGTTYEIILCPDLIANWLDWKEIKDLNDKQYEKSLKSMIELQKTIDRSQRLR